MDGGCVVDQPQHAANLRHPENFVAIAAAPASWSARSPLPLSLATKPKLSNGTGSFHPTPINPSPAPHWRPDWIPFRRAEGLQYFSLG